MARGERGLAWEQQIALHQMIGRLAWAVDVESHHIEQTFLQVDGNVLLPRRLRCFTCALCWQDAVRDGAPPIVRKEWILRMSWRCRVHGLPLSKAPMGYGPAFDSQLWSWLGAALAVAETLRWGLDYKTAMIERNGECLDKVIQQSRRQPKGRVLEYWSRFQANPYHFAHDRIAMLALAHSRKSRAVWEFEQLIARGVPARPGRNAESLKQPKPSNRLPVRCRLDGGRTQSRAFDLELFDMLCAYVVVRERCDTRVAAEARFGRSARQIW